MENNKIQFKHFDKSSLTRIINRKKTSSTFRVTNNQTIVDKIQRLLFFQTNCDKIKIITNSHLKEGYSIIINDSISKDRFRTKIQTDLNSMNNR